MVLSSFRNGEKRPANGGLPNGLCSRIVMYRGGMPLSLKPAKPPYRMGLNVCHACIEAPPPPDAPAMHIAHLPLISFSEPTLKLRRAVRPWR